MATPDFILELREHIGHRQLWLPGVTAYVLRERRPGLDEVLLVRRSDNDRWTPVTGICDPGEEPDVTAVRETLEETCVHIAVERLLWVRSDGPVTYPNGDECVYLDHAFRCRYLSGTATVGDDESSDVRWFGMDELPPLQPRFEQQLQAALAPAGPVRFGRVGRAR